MLKDISGEVFLDWNIYLELIPKPMFRFFP